MTPQPAHAGDTDPAERLPIIDSHGVIVGYDTDAQDAAAREHGLEL
jgi:hypothetical protein